MRADRVSPEVLIAEGELVRLTRSDVEAMKNQARDNERARIRLCAHPGIGDRLHEMFIVHQKNTYVRPHKHLNKSESTHVIEGSASWVMFDEAGGVTDVVHMGDYRSGREFFYRMSAPYYHTLLIHTDWIVFHEITNGPFDRADTIFAPWAPDEADHAGQRAFMERVARDVGKLPIAVP